MVVYLKNSCDGTTQLTYWFSLIKSVSFFVSKNQLKYLNSDASADMEITALVFLALSHIVEAIK